MKHLVIDARTLNSSGIGTYLQNLIPLLSSEFEVSLIVSENDIDTYKQIQKVRAIACSSPIYSGREQMELPLTIPYCDIFWSPHYNVPVFPIRAKKRVVTIHDVFHLAFLRTLPLRQRVYAKFMLSSAARLSDRVITVSRFSKAEIIKYLHTDINKITVIYNGISSGNFRALPEGSGARVLKRLGLPSKYILFVGNVKPNKNLKNLLAALSRLLGRKLGTYSLVIAGKKEGFITGAPEVYEMLEKDHSLKRHVTFTGHINSEDLPAIYNNAALLVFPSLYEGFGFPPLEAMACGCPVVVSNASSLPEVCGDAAYYVDPYDVNSIAEGMTKVLTDEFPRQDLIKKGLERAKLFSWEKSAKDHIKVFEEVLSTQ